MGASFNGKAYEEIYKHRAWKDAADMYEEQFAAKLYKTPYVQEAARTALTKLSKMLNAYYNDQGQARNLDEQTAQNAQAAQQAAAEIVGQPAAAPAGIFGRPAAAPAEIVGRPAAAPVEMIGELMREPADVQQAGAQAPVEAAVPQSANAQAARQTDEKSLNAVINGDGDLHERMTLLYNSMLTDGGENKEQIAESHSLKNMMAYITEDKRRDIPELQGVRIDLLEEMRQRKKGGDVFDTYSFARDLKKASDRRERRGNWLTRFFQGIHRGFVAVRSDKFTRRIRSEEDRQAGRARYEMKKQVNAQGMLQTAGPSGTALRMLGAYKLMGASLKELLYFRLALIAWMVSSKDHSLYEIMTGSQNAGVTGKEDLSEPATMYMTVDPIPVDVLRQEFALNRQFPHELVYRVMLNELRDKRQENARKKRVRGWREMAYSLFEPDFGRGNSAYARKFYGDEAKNAEAQEFALNIYTTGAYLAMNRGQKYGSSIAKRSLRDYGNEMGNGKYGNAFVGELKDSKIKNSIFNMVRISSRMAQDALEERGQLKEQAYGGDGDKTESAYRGQKLTSDLKAGENAEITLGSLTSSSKDVGQANVFYNSIRAKEGAGNTVMIEYKMHGKGAVDIHGVSSHIGEAEVLIPAKTKFKVVKPLRKAAITDQGIAWNEPEEADREEKKEGELAYGYVICLEEVEGPGSVKREEAGEIADMRQEIREDYNRRLQELRRKQEQLSQQEQQKLQEQLEEQEQKQEDEIWEILMSGRR